MATKKSTAGALLKKEHLELGEMIIVFYSVLEWMQLLSPGPFWNTDSGMCSEVVDKMAKGLQATYRRVIERIFGSEMRELGAWGRPQSNICKGRGFVPCASRG